ncbi:CRISPR-associated endonuclease Cas3'' [Wenjunlia tyrosinilytica]|nr:CRISPR-associated endonuclease Cas3'' [Wenjunlia tyrosinilytica]
MRRPGRAVDESAWGKSRGLDRPYPLVRHLLDAAAMALYLWDHYLSGNQRRSIAVGLGAEADPAQARVLVALCAGLHDIGKLSGFQLCDARGKEGLSREFVRDQGERLGTTRIGHAVAGMQAAPAVLAALGLGDTGMAEDEGVDRVAEIIGGHHGVFSRLNRGMTDLAGYQELFGGLKWADQRAVHAAAVHDLLGVPPLPERFEASAAVLVTGLVILADWLVSQESYLERRQHALRPSLQEHFEKSCRDAVELVREAGLVPVELARKDFAEAYDIKGEPNPLQRSVARGLAEALAVPEAGKAGILVVTAAPGDGKSETALEAERLLSQVCGTRGFAFLLPTMATSDPMHARVAGVLDRQGAAGAGLTLTHSMAWLNSAYSDGELSGGPAVLVCDGEEEGDTAARHQAAMRPRQWLRGGKRPLLAQWTVGTIDQALMAVLPIRHNALRLLALSGKTCIVDEAHAYDPYMQVLLGRLLNWLGAYGVPVVLLSATLPVSVSDRLVKEYLRGVGKHSVRELKRRSFEVPYPGWLYVDAATARCERIGEPDRQDQAAQRRMELAVQVESVVHTPLGKGGERARLAVIECVLEPLLLECGGEVGGYALVVCNTVGEAQDTYTWLRDRCAARGLGEVELVLLHARFPGDVREGRTRLVSQGMGRPGRRLGRMVVVATQVVEQSLDLDADLVVSDLAPLALLLQRAGRCWRHEVWWAQHGRPGGKPRPAWAACTGPRLVVLDPLLAGGGQVPKHWGSVYAEHLLLETSEVLAGLGPGPINIPDDVQALVEKVHGDRSDRFDWDSPRREKAWVEFEGENLAQRGMGESIAVPRVGSVDELHSLHSLGVEGEWQIATRLGADAVRLLCVYMQEDGSETLDEEGNYALPTPDSDGRIAVNDVRAVMRRTIPVRADWFKDAEATFNIPDGWSDHPMLGDLALLRQPVRGGEVQAVEVKGKRMWLDAELGLVRR